MYNLCKTNLIFSGEGNHEYKFFVDGQWLTDPNIPTIENGTGFKNHVIHVEKGDFDAFEALDMDMASVSKAQSHKARASMKPQPQVSSVINRVTFSIRNHRFHSGQFDHILIYK